MARWLLGLTLAVDLALMVILCKPITAPIVYEQTVKEEVAVVDQEQKAPGIHQNLREAMEAYNLQLSQDQSGPDSVDSYEAPGLNLEDYGMEADDAVGYVEIPAMDVTLPLYLGASRAHMNNGATVLGQTSMPIGGISTNCVIAAHRGWNGKAMFRNGMQLEQIYDGKHFPFYLYDDAVLSLGLISKGQPENTKKATWLYLPATRKQLERGMLRSGIQDPEDMCFQVGSSEFPMEVDVALDFKQESIFDLNDLAWAVARLDRDNLQKLGAVVALAEPQNASQIRCLAENLDLFQFAPGAHTPAEYGMFMIQQSGHFEYDPNLDEFYDYEKYGLQHMNQEAGAFTDRGYVAYHGTVSLEVLMMGETHQEEQTFQMGGM